ncbi:MAG TPA: S1 RNA-binding domain-containing protein, partial [Acidimicrobiia bacterium]|nr:S1 RNA-binding domain-containing protein [Acidimicrobiia bacterium]
ARRRRRRRVGPPPQAVNDPLAFIRFVADHKLGSEVEAQVEAFTSHGAFVLAGGARCYVPLASLGDPPPRSARQVLQKGEGRIFVVQALDPQRRGIELALPQFARVSGAPTAETVEAEIARAAEESAPHRGTAPAKRAGKGAKAPAKRARPSAGKQAAAPAKKKAAASGTKAAKRGARA